MRLLESIREVLKSDLTAATIGVFLYLFCIGNNIRVEKEESSHFTVIAIPLDSMAQDIVNTLKMSAGKELYNTQVFEMADNILNGFTLNSDNTVLITTGLMKYSLWTGNKYDFVTAVLAHEFGHVVFKHGSANSLAESRNMERQADYYAADLLYHSPYGCQIQVTFNQQMLNDYGSYELNTPLDERTHPGMKERLESAIKNCDSLRTTGTLPKDLYYESVPKTNKVVK